MELNLVRNPTEPWIQYQPLSTPSFIVIKSLLEDLHMIHPAKYWTQLQGQ